MKFTFEYILFIFLIPFVQALVVWQFRSPETDLSLFSVYCMVALPLSLFYMVRTIRGAR